jgi:transcriptional regulator with XRE-family HTH domain
MSTITSWQWNVMVDVVHSQGVIDNNKIIGKRLERLRMALGLPNQAEFCRKLGVAPNRWNQYENGSRRITLDVVNKLRQRFGVTADYIYFGDESGLPRRITDAFLDAAE